MPVVVVVGSPPPLPLHAFTGVGSWEARKEAGGRNAWRAEDSAEDEEEEQPLMELKGAKDSLAASWICFSK